MKLRFVFVPAVGAADIFKDNSYVGWTRDGWIWMWCANEMRK